jgi:plasmid stabilization system protein ParE
MMGIEITPEAYRDLENLKEYLNREYGARTANRVIKAVTNDIRRLEKYPETDIKLFERFGIITDYKCIYTQKNYAFYRIEGECIKIVRILSEKRDFLYALLGIRMISDEENDYWENY